MGATAWAHLDGHHVGHLGSCEGVEERQEHVGRRNDVMREEDRGRLDAARLKEDPCKVHHKVHHRDPPERRELCSITGSPERGHGRGAASAMPFPQSGVDWRLCWSGACN